MSFDYGPILSVAASQIADKGRGVTYVSVGPSDYNPAIDELQGALLSEKEITGVFSVYNENVIDGTIIKQDDKLLIITPQQNITPKINDVVIDGETRYKVVSVKIIAPGKTPVLYKLQLRR